MADCSMMKELKARRKLARGIFEAGKWMDDARRLLKTPGFGLPDACDSARTAVSALKRTGVIKSS